MSIRVLVASESPLACANLCDLLEKAGGIEAIALQVGAFALKQALPQFRPQVVVLDLRSRAVSGLAALDMLMRGESLPTVVLVSTDRQGEGSGLRALELGAVMALDSPEDKMKHADYAAQLATEVRAAAGVTVLARPASVLRPVHPADVILAKQVSHTAQTSGDVVVMGASTGGVDAIRTVLQGLPVKMPPILIVQHMPASFTRTFSMRLNALCKIEVQEAAHGVAIQRGHAYIASGNAHLLLARERGRYLIHLNDGPPVNRHRPAIDVLFRSAANVAGGAAVGVLFTGMGKDGAKGLLEMKGAGAHTFAQDEGSSVVFGMPREAVALGAVDEVVPLDQLAECVLAYLAGFPRQSMNDGS